MDKLPNDDAVVEFWQRLEAERFGAKKVMNQQMRDRIMFQAGRFAEGARDTDALWGNREISKVVFRGTFTAVSKDDLPEGKNK